MEKPILHPVFPPKKNEKICYLSLDVPPVLARGAHDELGRERLPALLAHALEHLAEFTPKKEAWNFALDFDFFK